LLDFCVDKANYLYLKALDLLLLLLLLALESAHLLPLLLLLLITSVLMYYYELLVNEGSSLVLSQLNSWQFSRQYLQNYALKSQYAYPIIDPLPFFSSALQYFLN